MDQTMPKKESSETADVLSGSSLVQLIALLSSHCSLVASLSLFNGWVFAMSWSGVFDSVFGHGFPGTGSGIWSLSLIVCTIVLGIFLAFPRFCRNVGKVNLGLSAALMSTSIIFALLSGWLGSCSGFLFALSGLASGLGTGLMTAYWGPLIIRYDSSVVLKFIAVSLFAAACITVVISLLPRPISYAVMLAAPFFMMKSFQSAYGLRIEKTGQHLQSAKDAEEVEPTSPLTPDAKRDEHGLSPLVMLFLGLTAVLGISAGLLREFAHVDTQDSNSWIFGAAVMCAALMLLVSKVPERGESFSLFYRSIALIATAFIVFAVVVQQMDHRALLALGLHTIGFIYFYGLIWVFCVIYAQEGNTPMRIFVGGFFANQAGQIIGTLFGGALSLVLDSQSIIASASNAMIYLLLFSVIVLMARLSSTSQRGPFMISDERVGDICALAAKEYRLTRRESEILPFLVRGYDRGFIADSLGISSETVKSHTRHIYEKLDVHSRVELFNVVALSSSRKLEKGEDLS